MKINAILLLCLVWFSAAPWASAQETAAKDTLVGWVINKNGKGIKNIPVTVAGTKQTVRTNKNGIFTIVGHKKPDTVNILLPSKTFIQVPVAGMNFLKIFTKENGYSVSEAKDEIVNIGYGEVKKSASTSAGVSITGDQLRATGERNIIQAIVGLVPGVNVIYDGSGPSLRIRGGTSFESGNAPLYVVDGSIVDNIDYINLNDIEKVDVLKDGSMYGSRGANGVVIVTTKN